MAGMMANNVIEIGCPQCGAPVAMPEYADVDVCTFCGSTLARERAVLGKLTGDPRWVSPPPRLKTPVWTDDYTSLFSVFIW